MRLSERAAATVAPRVTVLAEHFDLRLSVDPTGRRAKYVLETEFNGEWHFKAASRWLPTLFGVKAAGFKARAETLMPKAARLPFKADDWVKQREARRAKR